MTYQYAVPRALNCYRDLKLTGLVAYQEHTLDVPALTDSDPFVQSTTALIRILAAARPPTRVPSRQECRFCDITAEDCPDRVDNESHPEEGTTEDF